MCTVKKGGRKVDGEVPAGEKDDQTPVVQVAKGLSQLGEP